MQQHTPVGVTYAVIAILGMLAFMSIGTMCTCAVLQISIQESLMTALISLSGSLSGAVGAMLVNTRVNNQPVAKSPETE